MKRSDKDQPLIDDIRLLGRIESPSEFEQMIVKRRGTDVVRLGQIAKVRDDIAERRALALLDGGTVGSFSTMTSGSGEAPEDFLLDGPDGLTVTGPIAALAGNRPNLTVEMLTAAELTAALAQLRLVSRQTLALLCGHPDSVDAFARRLYLAGLPRNQLLADVFLPRG